MPSRYRYEIVWMEPAHLKGEIYMKGPRSIRPRNVRKVQRCDIVESRYNGKWCKARVLDVYKWCPLENYNSILDDFEDELTVSEYVSKFNKASSHSLTPSLTQVSRQSTSIPHSREEDRPSVKRMISLPVPKWIPKNLASTEDTESTTARQRYSLPIPKRIPKSQTSEEIGKFTNRSRFPCARKSLPLSMGQATTDAQRRYSMPTQASIPKPTCSQFKRGAYARPLVSLPVLTGIRKHPTPLEQQTTQNNRPDPLRTYVPSPISPIPSHTSRVSQQKEVPPSPPLVCAERRDGCDDLVSSIINRINHYMKAMNTELNRMATVSHTSLSKLT